MGLDTKLGQTLEGLSLQTAQLGEGLTLQSSHPRETVAADNPAGDGSAGQALCSAHK